MNAKNTQPEEPENQKDYETAVLDFLDKEMVRIQSTMKEKEQSEELDTLMANLMQQVIEESDQAQSSGEMLVTPEDMNSILEEFTPQEEPSPTPANAGAPKERETAPEPVQAPAHSLDEHARVQEAVDVPAPEASIEQPADIEASPVPAEKAVASRSTLKSRRPMIAAAACILAVAGFAIYYFSRPSGKTSMPETASVAVPAAPGPEVAVRKIEAPTQPATKPTSSPAATPIENKKPPAASPKAAAPVPVTVPVPVTLAQKLPIPQVIVPVSAPPPTISNPVPPKEERPIEVQNVQAQPQVVPRTISERPAPPVVINQQATAGSNSATPSPQPPAPVAAPAATPVVAKSLVPAVPISQVSPKYPEFALRTRTSATVVLELDIDKQGKVVKATPVSGPVMFHREAINAAMQWRYKPASLGDANVASQVKVTFNFNLKKQ